MLIRQNGYAWLKIISKFPGRSLADLTGRVEDLRKRALNKAGKLPEYLQNPIFEVNHAPNKSVKQVGTNSSKLKARMLGIKCPVCSVFLSCAHLMRIGLQCCGAKPASIAQSLCAMYGWWTLIRVRHGDSSPLSSASISELITVRGSIPPHVTLSETDRVCLVLGEAELRRIFRAAGNSEPTKVARLKGKDVFLEKVDVDSIIPNWAPDDVTLFHSAGTTFCGVAKKFSLWPDVCMKVSHQRGDPCRCERLCSATMILNKLVRESDGQSGDRPIFYPLHERCVKEKYLLPLKVTRAHRAKYLREKIISRVKGAKPAPAVQVTTLDHLKAVATRHEGVKEVTEKNYAARLETVFADQTVNVLHYLWSPKIVLTHWVEIRGYTLNSVHAYVTLIKVLLRNMTRHELTSLVKPFPVAPVISMWSTVLFTVLKMINHRRDQQTTSARERANWVEVKDVEMLMQKLQRIDTVEARQWYLYLRLMQAVTVRNDYRTITFDTKDPNHINILEGVLILTKFKNDRVCKSVREQLTPELMHMVTAFQNDRGGSAYKGHLFLNWRGLPFTTKAFSNYMMRPFKQEFGKNVGSQMLRKIWATEQQKNEPTLREEQRRAENMLHSVHQHKQYRRL